MTRQQNKRLRLQSILRHKARRSSSVHNLKCGKRRQKRIWKLRLNLKQMEMLLLNRMLNLKPELQEKLLEERTIRWIY